MTTVAHTDNGRDPRGLRPIPRFIFGSRWLQLPLYLGLIVAQGVYVLLFLKELLHLVTHATTFNEQQIMLIVLGLIDVVMISNLLMMVIVGGYETFVSRLELKGHPDQPEWLSHVNASVLKIKLAMAIIGISSIHLLRTFIEAGALGTADATLHRGRHHVADDHPRPVHPVGHRHRLRRLDFAADRRGAQGRAPLGIVSFSFLPSSSWGGMKLLAASMGRAERGITCVTPSPDLSP